MSPHSSFPTLFTRHNCFITNKFLASHQFSAWPLNIRNTGASTQPPLLCCQSAGGKCKTWIETWTLENLYKQSLKAQMSYKRLLTWRYLGRSKPNTCDKAGIVGHPQPPPPWCVIESLDNVWTLIELLSNVFMLGLRLTESHRECHFNSQEII